MASSTISFRACAVEPHPCRSRAAATGPRRLERSSSSTSPSCATQARARFIQRLIDSLFETQRMKPIEDQQARHQFIPPQSFDDARPAVAS